MFSKETIKRAKWGFLRETKELAKKAGKDIDTGLFRTGLEVYLKKIYPNVDDWIHDEVIPECERKFRPDYRSEKLKIIVEFDGLPHYTEPDTIIRDKEKTKFYESIGYKVVRIPYFIQLSNDVIYKLFGISVDEEMFPSEVPSLGIKGKNTPAYLCGLGICRMASEFKKFPNQYRINIEFLESQNNDALSGVSLLKAAYECRNLDKILNLE